MVNTSFGRRLWMSLVSLLTICTALAYAGNNPNLAGGGCEKGEEESQAGSSPGDGGKDNSDPIYLATGDFQRSETDLFIPGRGLDFELKRMYRSKSGTFSRFTVDNPPSSKLDDIPRDRMPLGINWDHNYNIRIDIDGEGPAPLESPDPEPVIEDSAPLSIFLYDGTGRWDEFEPYTTHDPEPGDPALYSNDMHARVFLYSVYYAYIVMYDENNIRYRFHPFFDDDASILPYAGRIESITDRNGNQLQFSYETSNGVERLASMTDTLGHTITFLYHDDPASPLSSAHDSDHTAHLLWRVVDHADRVVEYDFENVSGDFRARLTSATLPSIENTSDFPLQYTSASTTIDHARFTAGRKWSYEYAPAQTSGWFRDGLMTKVTDPNGVVIIQNEYSDAPQLQKRHVGRVVRQQYGDEAYNYVLTDVEGDRTRQSMTHDYYVWVNDRRGAITRFKYAKWQASYGPGEPHDLQLIEKTEFLGFVDNPDLRVWATYNSSGVLTGWKYLNSSGNEQALLGTTPGQAITTTFTPDPNWNVAGISYPSGNSTGQTYQNHDFPPPSGTFPDPRFNRTVTSRTQSGPGGTPSITEYWRYDFNFSGGGGGCGCGSSGFETAYRDGNGNVTFKVYDTAVNAFTGRSNGNLLAVYHGLPPASSMTPGETYAAANAAAIDEYTYNQWGQVVTHTHPEKIIWNSSGVEIAHRRVDQFDYYNNPSDPANHGRLHKKRIDVNGFDLTTTYEYDLLGNVIKETGPDGDVTEYLYNQASQLVRVRRFDDALTRFSEKMFFYDANGNLVVEEVLNLDEDLNPVADSIPSETTRWFTTVHAYDKLGYRTETSREKAEITGIFSGYTGSGKQASSQATNTDFITQQWGYDANRNLTMFEDGEAVGGGQASNVVEHEYDARDLRIETVAGVGGAAPLKTRFEYDDDGRLITRTVNPDGSGDPQYTDYAYDDFNRVVSMNDPMGNEFIYEYDDNHNIVSVVACGPHIEDTVSPSDDFYTLAKIGRVYDTLDRYTSQSVTVFDYDYSTPSGETCGMVPGGSTQQTTNFDYNADSSVFQVDAPSGNGAQRMITTHIFDTVGRLEVRHDEAGNTALYEYSADSDITEVTQTDVSSDDPLVFEVYKVEYDYDALGRRISVLDGVNNRTEYYYDSRSNMVEMTDPRDNITRYAYDSMSRRISSTRVMTDTGDGTGTQIAGSAGTIFETQGYDDSSRLISETDDNGNTTVYDYDGLNRVAKVTMPDGEFYSVAYDANGNAATYTDARGVVVTQIFDLNNRLVSRAINDSAVSGGIPGATSESFTYDGLGRLRTAVNNFSEITREYDSRSNVLREIQNADAGSSFAASYDRVVEYAFNGANNNELVVYPSGREVYRTYDSLNRLSGIYNDDQMTDPLTEFDYFGRRVARRVHGNGTETGYGYSGHAGATPAPGDKGFGRVNAITTTDSATSAVLDAFAFTWDANQNRTGYFDTGSGMKNRRERSFEYDSSDRLIATDVDFPDPATDFPSPTNNGVTNYTLDGVHNRTSVSGFEGAGAPLGGYTRSGVQSELNQYSVTPREAGGEWFYEYDANGNMTLKAQNSPADYNGDFTHNYFDLSAFLAAYNNGDPEADYNGDGQVNYFDFSEFNADYGPLDGTDLEHWHFSYDFRNQLVEIGHGVGDDQIVWTTNTYDALARRVLESTSGQTKQLVYGGISHWEVLEQIDLSQSSEQVLTTHVYGIGIDDEVSYRIEDLQTPEDVWTHRDDLNSLTSITNESGVVKERYEYGDYGEVSMYDENGDLLANGTQFYATHLYTGRLQIGGTGLYDYRFRVLEPETGRFAQRDPLGTIDRLNVYVYARDNSHRFTDPLGLRPPEEDLEVQRPDGCLREEVYTANWHNWRGKCKKWLEKIENIKEQIAKRKLQIETNEDLPYAAPDDHLPGQRYRSVRGHEQIVRDLEKRLRELEDHVERNKCRNGPKPPGAPFRLPAFEPAPVPWLDGGYRPSVFDVTLPPLEPRTREAETGAIITIIIIITAPFWALG